MAAKEMEPVKVRSQQAVGVKRRNKVQLDNSSEDELPLQQRALVLSAITHQHEIAGATSWLNSCNVSTSFGQIPMMKYCIPA